MAIKDRWSSKSKLLLFGFISIIFYLFFTSSTIHAQTLRFVSWGDTKSGTSTLSAESNQAKALNPKFTIYAGDLVSSWSIPAIEAWVVAVNGGNNNGMRDITFPVRGNHDSGASQADWSNYFNQAQTAARVGATNYSELTKDLTYSFDWGNSHFVGIDVIGDVTRMSSAQIAWLDNDLTAAESRGLTHAFLYWHGPIYALAEHCCPAAPSALISVLNKHPIVSATFHGHEHVTAYTHINSSRIPAVTHEFEEFVTGDAGAGPDTCQSGRFDYCMTNETRAHGFVTVDVSGAAFTVNFYKLGTTSPQKTMTFSKSGLTPTKTPTPTPKPTIPTKIPGDLDKDGDVDIFDYNLLIENFGSTSCGNVADIDGNCKVDIFDYNTLVENFGKTG